MSEIISNGNGVKTWLMSALLALLMAGGGWIWNNTTARISTLEAAVSNKDQRIAVIEAEFKQITDQLNRLEDKLDTHLEDDDAFRSSHTTARK